MIKFILVVLDFLPPEVSLIVQVSGYLDQLEVALVVQVAKLHQLPEKCCTPQVVVQPCVEQSLQLMRKEVGIFLCPPLGVELGWSCNC